MKHEPAARTHLPTDPPPTVIHHPEEDETILARWLRHALAKGPSFWIMLAGAVAITSAVAYLVGGVTSGDSADSNAWGEVMLASTPEEMQKVADLADKTRAGEWAGLMAASERYREGVSRLPTDRDAAAPILSQALEGFRTTADGAKGDETLRRLALIGVARTLESRDELADAIAAYTQVAETWPDTVDGKEAAERAKRLQEPAAVAFYKQFSEYKPKASSTTIGPRGTNRLDLPLGHPSIDGGAMPAPPLTGGVPPGSVPEPSPATGGELPGQVFQKDEPKADAPAPALPTDAPFQNNPAPK